MFCKHKRSNLIIPETHPPPQPIWLCLQQGIFLDKIAVMKKPKCGEGEGVIPRVEVVSDRLLAGDYYESDLIALLYEIDAGVDVEGFDIDEVDSITDGGNSDQTKARINELLESLGIKSRDWVDSLAKTAKSTDFQQGNISLRGRNARRIKLEGTSIGEYFTEAALRALPIELGEDVDSVDSEIVFELQSGYTLRLCARGSVEFIYPEEDEEGKDSEVLYTIKYTATLEKAAIA